MSAVIDDIKIQVAREALSAAKAGAMHAPRSLDGGFMSWRRAHVRDVEFLLETVDDLSSQLDMARELLDGARELENRRKLGLPEGIISSPSWGEKAPNDPTPDDPQPRVDD